MYSSFCFLNQSYTLRMHLDAAFRKLTSPQKIQDFLNTLPFNHEKHGETYMSPARMLKAGTAHCFEGALFAAACLQYHGHKPLIMDLSTTKDDQDHVVALYRVGKYWGAISKTNHHILRFREPIYASVRELALSYFHEYFLEDGTKTLRTYSDPFDLSKWKKDWVHAEEDLYDLVNALCDAPHHEIVPKNYLRKLRKADKIERVALKTEEWPKKGGR
jgi:hypothetical protein